MKLAATQQASLCSQIESTYQLTEVCSKLINHSKVRSNSQDEVLCVFEAYITELLHVYHINKKTEDALKEAASKAAKDEAEAAAKALAE